MRITPLDVRKQEFNKSMRGFDCDEVRAFLNTLADEYETILIDNKQIRERVMEQDEKITEYMAMERTLRDTLMTAERVMSETRENAGREGDLIIQEAQLKAKGVLEECRLRTEELRREIVGLRKEKETYLARFRGLAEAQISFIDTHESDFDDLDKRLVDIVDNVVTSATINEPIKAFRETPTAGAALATPALDTNQGDAPGPEVAPAPVPAPVAAETDIWRDYNPGQSASNPSANEEDVAGNIADIVSESLVETTETPDEATLALESLNIDELPGDGDHVDDGSESQAEVITETANV